MRTFLVVVSSAMVVACGAGTPAAQGEPATQFSAVGTYGVRYEDDTDAAALDATVIATVNALETVYPGVDLDLLLETISVRVVDDLPSGVDGC